MNIFTKIIAFLFFTGLISCTVHKNLNTSEKMLAVKTETKSVAEQFKQSKTVTDIKETADTFIYTDSGNTYFSPLLIDTETQTLETPDLIVTFNSEKGKAKIHVHQKPKKVPVKFDRNTHSESAVDQTTKATTEVKQAVKSKEKESAKVVEKTGLSFPWWVWGIIILLILAALGRGCYILYKRVKGSGWV